MAISSTLGMTKPAFAYLTSKASWVYPPTIEMVLSKKAENIAVTRLEDSRGDFEWTAWLSVTGGKVYRVDSHLCTEVMAGQISCQPFYSASLSMYLCLPSYNLPSR
jgi:hypothetical protein